MSRRRVNPPKGPRTFEINWRSVLNGIYLLDGYRVGTCYDPTGLEKAVAEGTMGREFSENWKNLKPILYKMADAPGRPEDVIKLLDLNRIMQNITKLSIIPLVGLFMASQFLKLSWLFPYVFLYGFLIPPLAIISRQYISSRASRKIRQFYDNHPDKFLNQRTIIKKEVQRLIDMTCSHVVQSKDPPKIYKFKIKQPDYDNIEIVKRPTRFRVDYVARPKPVT